MRERNAGALSPLEYWLATGLATMATGVTYVLLLGVPVYFLAGFRLDALAFQSTIFALLMAHANGHGMVEFFATRAENGHAAFAFYPIVVMLSIHTAGYTIKTTEMSPYSPWRWCVWSAARGVGVALSPSAARAAG
jgi:hypothetical protein